MTIKIIRHGTLPEARPYKATCRHCDCHFEFHRGDATFVADQRDGDYLFIPCPTCKQQVTVSAERLAPLPHDWSAAQ